LNKQNGTKFGWGYDSPIPALFQMSSDTRGRIGLLFMDYNRSKEGKYSAYERIDFPPDIQILPEESQAVGHAADGCGHFDWQSVELVSKHGQRVQVARGVYENIVGIYWLKAGSQFNLDMLEDIPDDPILVGENYVLPPFAPGTKSRCDDSVYTDALVTPIKEKIRRIECYTTYGYSDAMSESDLHIYKEYQKKKEIDADCCEWFDDDPEERDDDEDDE
jgi:hypothetical protein